VAVARCEEIERRLATYKRGDEPAMEHPEAYEYFRQTLAEMPAELCHAVVELLRQRLSPEELRHAWGRELERRVAEMDRGEVETLDAEESIAECRRALAESRMRRANP
ncbi:MAG TPA: addiction module protein, partial [Planctomycetaceae bacterium]|nr:addiction module protein [Planctomycetaceae bacterium]